MTSRIGYNVHATSPDFDKGKLLKHLQKVQPTWVLVMDGLQVCRDIKAALPQTNVIHRAYPDDRADLYQNKSPEQWVAEKKREIGNADVWVYTLNEMGFGDELLNWFTAVIIWAAEVNLKVVIGNFSVGTPEAAQWSKPAALAMLQALDKYRANAVLGEHEYACGVITSGFLGGYPDNAGVAPNSGAKGISLIQPENWPSAQDAAHMTKFHMGRFNFMVNTCHMEGIKPPRVVMTEWGFDDVSDIKPWAQTLPKTPPYTTIRGWKSHQEAWRWLFSKKQGWTPERAMFEQLKWADQTIYQNTVVEGQMVFSWGHSSIDWDQFDVSQAFEFQGMLEGYALMQQPPIETPPATIYPKVPSPDDARWKRVIAAPKGGVVNVRSVPDKSGSILAQIKAVDEVYILGDESHGIWIPVKVPVNAPAAVPILGWVSTDVVAFVDVPPEVPEQPSLLVEMSREDAMILASHYLAIAEKWSEIANR